LAAVGGECQLDDDLVRFVGLLRREEQSLWALARVDAPRTLPPRRVEHGVKATTRSKVTFDVSEPAR